MFLNKSFLIKALIGTLAVGVPAAVVGSYFAVSQLDKYREYYVTPTSDDPRGFVDAYKNAVYNGARIVLTPGFTHRTPIIDAFQNYESFFKDVGFLLYDESLKPQPWNNETGPVPGTGNTWNIMYRSDLGSIQCGVALGVFLNQYQDVFYDDNRLTFATYGGMPFSSVTSFMGGMQKGIEWFNSKINDLNSKQGNNSLDGTRHIDYQPVTQIVSSSGSEFAGGFGPGEGAAISENLISQNVDAIMPVAGPQTWTALNQIIKLNKKTIVIGVDSPAENDRQNKPLKFKSKYGEIGNGKYVQFSSIKNLSLSTVKALQIINNGNIAPNNSDPNYFEGFVEASTNIGGYGTVAVGTIKNQCVGVSDEGKVYFDWILKQLNAQDPALDPSYSNPTNMIYKVMDPNAKEPTISYGDLQQNFLNLAKDYNITPLNMKNVIQKGNSSDEDRIKIAMSSSTSILIDGSFAESCYHGLYEYYKLMDINIPNNVETFSLKRHQLGSKGDKQC